jgi:hypothetical protein
MGEAYSLDYPKRQNREEYDHQNVKRLFRFAREMQAAHWLSTATH